MDNLNCRAYTSLGHLRYLSCLKYVDLVVGNSSSGLAEVPTFKTPTINVGDRQKGRLRAKSVIDCLPISQNISFAIQKALSNEFQDTLHHCSNPYGEGGSSEKVVRLIESIDPIDNVKKEFYDFD